MYLDQRDETDILYVDTKSKLKVDIFLGRLVKNVNGHSGHKTGHIPDQDSKIGCISRMS